MNRPWILAVLPLLAMFGCEPVETDPGGLASFEGGVLQQAQLEGDPVSGRAAVEATPSQAPAADEGGLETVGTAPSAELDWGTTTPPADSGSEMPADSGSDAPVDAVAAADPGLDAAPSEESVAAGSGEEPPGEGADAAEEDALGAEDAAGGGSGSATSSVESGEAAAAVPGGEEATAADAGQPEADGSEPPEPPSMDDVLPEAPKSDDDALAALDAVASAAPAGGDTPHPPAALPCEPSDSFLSTPLRSLVLIQTWEEGGQSRAMVKAPDGATRHVGPGDLLGATGARVVSIGLGELVLAEIQFDMEGKPVLVQQRLRQPAPPAQ